VSQTRYAILNADDFGYNAEVNRAILKAHREGVLTSTSLMVAEEGAEAAIASAKENPRLGVGLHLVVTQDRPLLPLSEIPSLVRPNGRLDSDLFRAGLRYAFSATAQKQLQKEIEAQFARFAEAGLEWSHVDGHQHFHLPPTVWDSMIALCGQYGVHRLRYPSEPIREHLKSGGQSANLDTLAALVFRLLRKRNLRRLCAIEMQTGKPPFLNERVYGHLQTGRMDIDYCTRLVGRLQAKTNEIYFHPGAPHATLLRTELQTPDVRDVELHALLHPNLRHALETHHIQIGNYAEVEMWLRAEQNTEP
jgi:hopanoid biosynthesis associated protein HpnK